MFGPIVRRHDKCYSLGHEEVGLKVDVHHQVPYVLLKQVAWCAVILLHPDLQQMIIRAAPRAPRATRISRRALMQYRDPCGVPVGQLHC